jgi:integration host factor subunit beta
MNKSDLVEALKTDQGLTKGQAEEVIDIFFGEMAKALGNSDRVEIRGLCSFYVKNYKGYAGRNPKTSEVVHVTSKKLPFFKCGKDLKERVDYNETTKKGEKDA